MRRRRSANSASRYGRRDTDSWIDVAGRVVRLLQDDRDGERHQRFIVDIGGGETLLIAHNLDLAERVPVSLGDRISLRGMYEWNELGGLVHWTHHDPLGIEDGGFVRHYRRTYR